MEDQHIQEPESPQAEAQDDIEELLKQPSTLPPLHVTLRAFTSEAEARELGNAVGGVLGLVGKFLDLERLDGVTVAYDYDAALAEVDRGFEASHTTTATQDEFARGVAMAVQVLRKGRPAAHIVIAAPLVSPLTDPKSPDFQQAMYTLVHEAAHVHDLAYRDRAYPGVILQMSVDFRDHVLFGIAEACWKEYAACRLSARFYPDVLKDYESTFCSAFAGVRNRGNEHIYRYRFHGDLMELMKGVVGEYGAVLKYAAYLLGSSSGLGRTLAEAAPEAYSLTTESKWFNPILQRFQATLETMWAVYGKWSGIAVFRPLENVAHDLLRAAGVELKDTPEGPYIDVPFTPETTPLWPC